MKHSFLLLLLIASTNVFAKSISCFYNIAYEENNFIDRKDYTLKTSQNCYILIDKDDFDNNTAVIDFTNTLRFKNNTIGCYMSVGTIEKWRSDFKDFKKGIDYQSKAWFEWPNEYKIKGGKNGNPTNNTISLMKKRIDIFAKLGCEFIEMDNMDIDENDKMTNINGEAMRAYNMDLCNYIHSNNMKCMAKNTGPSDVDDNIFDGLSVESYPKEQNWWGTQHALHFINGDKPFMISHYKENTVDDCLGVWTKYKNIYNNSIFGFICSQYETNHYIHFGFTI